MKRAGKVWKYGDDVNTDVIFPGRFTYTLYSDAEMGKHALVDLDLEYNSNGKPGDIIVAGKNWGCGSSREQAVKCLKARGIGAIVAKSFSRIYYRNCLNEGVSIVICPEAVDAVQAGDMISIDFDSSTIVIEEKKQTFTFAPYPEYVLGLVQSGGLLEYVKKRLQEQGKLPKADA